MNGEIVTTQTRDLARADEEWSVQQIVAQTMKIQECMRLVMKRDEHYGVIPGTSTKPTLLKPGAEKLCLMFRLCPEYETVRAEQSSAFISYTIRCRLVHIPSSNLVATGLGSCNSREKKYTRPGDRKCPACGKPTIIKGKEEYGGGWLCFAKKGGCGAKYPNGDASVEQQDTGIADPSDLDNTILKMACKRALVAAVLNGTAASDCFTQDLEDLANAAAEYIPPAAKEEAKNNGPKGPDGPANNNGTTGRPTGFSTNGQTTGTSKPRTAADIPYCGEPLSPAQLKRIHALKDEVGGVFVGDEADSRTKWAKTLQVYRNAEGERITSSKDLCKTQATHLIERMEGYVRKQGARASQGLEVPPPSLPTLFGERFTDEGGAGWLHGLFGVEHLKELDGEQSETALQLLLALQQGPDAYDEREATARSMGKVR